MNLKLSFFIGVSFISLTFGDTLNAFGPSNYSLQIKTNGTLDVSSLMQWTMISCKKMISSTGGIRISTGISAERNNSKDITAQDDKSTGNESLSFSLHATYLKYFIRNKNLYVYYGVGPFVNYGYQFYSDLSTDKTLNSYTGGADGILGAEWFFSEHFSLFTEYNMFVSGKYNHTTLKTVGSNVVLPENKTTDYNLNYNTVLIGISTNF
jgi:hypothetical protein